MKQVLKSSRFQALVVLAIFSIFLTHGWIPQELWDAAIIILGGHIGIRTVDRASERIGTRK